MKLIRVKSEQDLNMYEVELECKRIIRTGRIAQIEIKPESQTRSSLQNRYLNGWVYKQITYILEDAGISIKCDDGTEIPYTRDILHDCVFSDVFRVVDEIEVMGVKKNVYEHTSDMNKARFSEYLDQVKKFCHSYWGITVPEPNEGYWMSILDDIKSRGH